LKKMIRSGRIVSLDQVKKTLGLAAEKSFADDADILKAEDDDDDDVEDEYGFDDYDDDDYDLDEKDDENDAANDAASHPDDAK